ncbi:cell cycle control protein 50A isoform X2 [Amblyomma americanum]
MPRSTNGMHQLEDETSESDEGQEESVSSRPRSLVQDDDDVMTTRQTPPSGPPQKQHRAERAMHRAPLADESSDGTPAAAGSCHDPFLSRGLLDVTVNIRRGRAAKKMSNPDRKSKKPSSSAFKQQRLSAWQPILTAGTVLPTFFVIGLAFVPIGIGLLVSSNEVQEFQFDYTECKEKGKNVTCASVIQNDITKTCVCLERITLPEDFKSEVYVYYGLTNFYQNHRRYVKSRDDTQLLGRPLQTNLDCEPFARDPKTGLAIAPCGAIANSIFNDTLNLKYRHKQDQTNIEDSSDVHLLFDKIAWPTDRRVKFKNPPGMNFNGTTKPPNWPLPVEEIGGFENESLIVWMRTAALPTFRKLYGRVDHTRELFVSSLPKGEYDLEIVYRYPVTPFKGSKRIILSNTSWLGGRNPFLGIAYIAVGSLCLALAFVFLVIHNKFGKNTHDLVNITQRTPY